MKTEPIRPARIVWLDDGQPVAADSRMPLPSSALALDRARSIFLAASHLPHRWRGQDHFTVLELGFGFGHNFLQTWLTWKQDPQAPERLTYVALEARPSLAADLQQAHRGCGDMAELAAALVAAWPPLTPNLHLLEFDAGRVRLLLALGGFERLLPALQLKADAVYLDGAGLNDPAAAFTRRTASSLARLMARNGTLVAAPIDAGFDRHLRTAGFSVTPLLGAAAPGPDVSAEQGLKPQPMSGPIALHASYTPHFQPTRVPQRQATEGAAGPQLRRSVIVIGGGLAGALAAQALARSGWTCVVLDRNPQPAQEASGNPAGLFHGAAHAGDGLHARFSRTAALLAARRYAALVDAGAVSGEVKGVLRLFASASVPDMPASYVEALTSAQATARAHCTIKDPAWLYPGGGWMSPGELCAEALKTPGVSWQGHAEVRRLTFQDGLWRAWGPDGRCIAEAPVVVCATGAAPPPFEGAGDLPLSAVRGQVSWTDPETSRDLAALPAMPLTGHGYALRMPDGRLLFGASSQADEHDPELRTEDQHYNQKRLEALCGIALPTGTPLMGRVGWRATMPDRLPIVGAWPVAPAQLRPATRLDHCRMVPRVPGLFVLMGLASRGLTWGPLAAEVLQAWINGRPMPLETDLLDAIDPARTLVRRLRRRSTN